MMDGSFLNKGTDVFAKGLIALASIKMRVKGLSNVALLYIAI